MSSTRSPSSLSETAGFIGGLVRQARLVWRLLNDGRVPGWAKMIPVAGLLYLLSPIDLIPDLMLPGLGELDDLAVILLSAKMFVDLAPPGVVREHLEALLGRRARPGRPEAGSSDAYVDVPYRIVDPDPE